MLVYSDELIADAISRVAQPDGSFRTAEVAALLGTFSTIIQCRVRDLTFLEVLRCVHPAAATWIEQRYPGQLHARRWTPAQDRDKADFNGVPELPDAPTSALPGSARKIQILAERALAQRELFHPDDATDVADGQTLAPDEVIDPSTRKYRRSDPLDCRRAWYRLTVEQSRESCRVHRVAR